MRKPPAGFSSCLREIHSVIRNVDGWLTDREVEFLALLAACPTTAGEVLEIGSFRGKSTIVLARAARLAGTQKISAVDPFPLRGTTIHDKDGNPSAKALYERNLRRAGVMENVETWQMLSSDLVKQWNQPLRLLWVDGDHSREGATLDFTGFNPSLADGAVIACHDILSPFGCTQAFREHIVENPHFGPIGFCGSIGWAKYRKNPAATIGYRRQKQTLSRRLKPICGNGAFTNLKADLKGWASWAYRYHRWWIPHRRIDPANWLKQAA